MWYARGFRGFRGPSRVLEEQAMVGERESSFFLGGGGCCSVR